MDTLDTLILVEEPVETILEEQVEVILYST